MVKLFQPLRSETASGTPGLGTYKRTGVHSLPYPRDGTYPAKNISQYYSVVPWTYERRRTWHGLINIAKRYAIQPESRTAGQINQRTKFCQGYVSWNALSGPEKGIWNSYAIGKPWTGYDRFMHYYLKGRL